MIKKLFVVISLSFVAISLLFVTCSTNNPIYTYKPEEQKIENKSQNQFSGLSTVGFSSDFDVKEITINNQKYVVAVGYHCISICPSKNE